VQIILNSFEKDCFLVDSEGRNPIDCDFARAVADWCVESPSHGNHIAFGVDDISSVDVTFKWV